MRKAIYFKSEIYECGCGIELTKELIGNIWLCPKCNEYIKIYEQESGKQCTFIRKQAKDIVAGDLVWIETIDIDEFYKVVGVTEFTVKGGKAKLGIGLQGYGQIKANHEDIIACRIGVWSK